VKPSVQISFLSLVGLIGLGSAQAATLKDFLAALEQNPSLRGASLGAGAAQTQLEATRGGFELGFQGGYGLSEFKTTPGDALSSQNSTQLGLSLTFRPFLYGDTQDAYTRAALQARQARAGYRSTLTGLQIQAVLASEQLRLATEALLSSTVGAELAQTLLNVTQTQLERGVVSGADLREAQSRNTEARERLTTAGENLRLAQTSLENLVGKTTLDAAPEFALPTGKTGEEEGAEVTLENARLVYAQAQRSALPTGNIGYTLNTSDSTSVGVSLESRTFQPKLSFSYADPSQGTRQVSVVPPVSVSPTQSVQIGLAWSFGPSALTALSSAEQNLRSAEASLEGARLSAKLGRDRLTVALDQAGRNVALKQSALENAQKKLAEALERQKLGLASPLVALSASSELSATQIALSSAKLDALQKRLEFYRTYSVPLMAGSP